MTIIATWRRTAAAVASLAVAALLLSGCVLASKEPLIPESEAVEALPASFTFTTYEGSGPYTKSKDPGGVFTKAADGATYNDPTGGMKVFFVPRGDAYAVNIITTDGSETGAMYGVGRIRDGILELKIIFTADPGADLAAAGVAVPAGVAIEEGGVSVTDRAGLEAILDLMASGTIKADPLIAFVGDGEPPPTIVKDGDWYKKG